MRKRKKKMNETEQKLKNFENNRKMREEKNKWAQK
jgi:hypothetical protein